MYQNSDMNTFGQRLKTARKDAKLTQAQVAKKVGMSQSALSELEGDAYPTSTYTPRLAHLYGVQARWLADGDGAREAGGAGELVVTSDDWPFQRINKALFDALPQKIKDDIEDYIEMKIVKANTAKAQRTTKSAA